MKRFIACLVLLISLSISACTGASPEPHDASPVPSPSRTKTLEELIKSTGYVPGSSPISGPVNVGKAWQVTVAKPTMEVPFLQVNVLVSDKQMQQIISLDPRNKDDEWIDIGYSTMKSLTTPEQYARVLVARNDELRARVLLYVQAAPEVYSTAKIIQLDGTTRIGETKYGDVVLTTVKE